MGQRRTGVTPDELLEQKKPIPGTDGRGQDPDARPATPEETIRRLSAENERLRAALARTRTENALRAGEGNFRQIVDKAQEGIWVIDQQGVTTYVNQRMADMLGAALEEMIGHSAFTYVAEGARTEARTYFANIMGGKVEKHDFKFTRCDGEELWTIVSASPLTTQDGETLGALALVTDITARVETESRIKEMVERLSAQNEGQKAVITLAVRLRSAASLDELQREVTRLTADILDADAAALLMRENDAYRLCAGAGRWDGVNGMQHPGNIPEFDQLLDTRQTKYYALADFPDRARLLEGLSESASLMSGLKSFLLAPLLAGENSVGILLAGSYRADSNLARQANMLSTIAEIGGISIQKMRSTDMMERVIARRTGELSALYNVISVAGKPWGIQERLMTALDQVLLSLNCQMGGIFFLDEHRRLKIVVEKNLPQAWKEMLQQSDMRNTWEMWVLEHGELLIVPDIYQDDRCRFPKEGHHGLHHVYIGVPIRLRDRTEGVVSIFREGGQIFGIEEITFITALVNHVSVIIENTRLIDQAEKAVLIEERARLARELHDSVTQTLYSAAFFAEAAHDLADQGNLSSVKEYLEKLSMIAGQALREMRMLVFELRPPILEDEGLVAALRQRLEMVENRVSIQTRLTTNIVLRLNSEAEEVLYWCAIEALNNIARHAQASTILLDISVEDNMIVMTVKDDGVGFDQHASNDQHGLGLRNMRERLRKVNGYLLILSAPRTGTVVRIVIPEGEPVKELRYASQEVQDG